MNAALRDRLIKAKNDLFEAQQEVQEARREFNEKSNAALRKLGIASTSIDTLVQISETIEGK